MRNYIVWGVLGAIIIIAFFSWRFSVPGGNKKENIAEVEIRGITFEAEIALDTASRMRGLSGRAAIRENEGMLFLFDTPGNHRTWAKDMNFSLDIFWIRDGQIVDIEESVPAPAPGTQDAMLPTYGPDAPADMIFEIRGGFAARYGVHIGDKVKIISGLGGDFLGLFPDLEKKSEEEGDITDLHTPSRYFIETLMRKPQEGGDFTVGSLVETDKIYKSYRITYQSGKYLITGIMSVPQNKDFQEALPVIILNHGLIEPKGYISGHGSTRERKFFAEHGYVAIHPDFRGHASSSPHVASHHDFYEGYTEDVINLVGALKKTSLKFIDATRIGMWGHSMGGGIAARVVVRVPEVRAYVLFAPISADVEDNFYELSKDEVEWIHDTYGSAGADVYKKMSPLSYFSQVNAPMQLHHGTADKEVPLRFSEKMYDALKRNGKKAEFFKYPDETHEFGSAWSVAISRSLQFFDKYVKNTK